MKLFDFCVPVSQNIDLIKRVDNDTLNQPFYFFDKDGFDLNQYEQQIYKQNDVFTQSLLNRIAHHFVWFKHEQTFPGLYVDHCFNMARFQYRGPLREQLQQHSKTNPLVNKLLNLKGKWGLDVDIEYIFDDGDVIEVFHYERDYYDYDEYLNDKHHLEIWLQNTNFEDFAFQLKATKEVWHYLPADAQNDYKVQNFGFPKSFNMLKVI